MVLEIYDYEDKDIEEIESFIKEKKLPYKKFRVGFDSQLNDDIEQLGIYLDSVDFYEPEEVEMAKKYVYDTFCDKYDFGSWDELVEKLYKEGLKKIREVDFEREIIK